MEQQQDSKVITYEVKYRYSVFGKLFLVRYLNPCVDQITAGRNLRPRRSSLLFSNMTESLGNFTHLTFMYKCIHRASRVWIRHWPSLSPRSNRSIPANDRQITGLCLKLKKHPVLWILNTNARGPGTVDWDLSYVQKDSPSRPRGSNLRSFRSVKSALWNVTCRMISYNAISVKSLKPDKSNGSHEWRFEKSYLFTFVKFVPHDSNSGQVDAQLFFHKIWL